MFIIIIYIYRTLTNVNNYDGNDTATDQVSEESQIFEEHSQNEEDVELSNNIESETQKKKHNFDACKKNVGKNSDVCKVISFIGKQIN